MSSRREIKWRIYYADGSTFDNTQGTPKDAPFAFGVICIVQPNPETGREILHASERYFYRDDQELWYSCDHQSWEWYAVRYLHLMSCFRPGESVPLLEYRSIYARANTDPDFPRRSAYGAHEPQITWDN